MRLSFQCFLFFFLCSLGLVHAEDTGVELSWTYDEQIRVFTNHQTGFFFPPKVGRFKRILSNPSRSDGSALFIYKNKSYGHIIVSLSHKNILGYYGDESPVDSFLEKNFKRVQESYRGIYYMIEPDLKKEERFSLEYKWDEQIAMGRGFFVHLDNPFKMKSFESFAVIDMNGFLYFFEGDFKKKKGIKYFMKFLQELGIEKSR